MPDVRFNAVDPGHTAPGFTGALGHSAGKGATPAVRLAALGAVAPTGTITDIDGVLPW